MNDKRLSHELLTFKKAFSRAVDMIGGVERAAEALGVSPGQITRWRRDNYPDTIPGNLFPRVDAFAGYPVMLEAYGDLAGYTIRKDDVTDAEMPICVLAGNVAADTGHLLRTVLTADADTVITPREFNCIEAEGRTVIVNVTRTIDAARAKCEGTSVVPMKAAAK
ncbi:MULTISPECIES: hypothetical protein [unclassified Aurantimonas]|uniref:hypothetical protein n=1 Tax=unclassified Aurantimonas TaxID=2638230 RepID=UPI002E17DB89|nr:MULTISPECIES: hypothetical protein [unclassified Aurantimonas]MEC5289418.1 hypothetical protein [Aurantimonas sp. C2-3-R2]MEC5410498.1 hypothetical protein [Aurantimonas sp. C2-4-R8]